MGIEPWKIKNHLNDTPGTPFPKFVSLDPSECQLIRGRLAAAFTLECDSENATELWEAMCRIQPVPLGRVPNATEAYSDEWLVQALLEANGVLHTDPIYINWRHFDDVDRFESAVSVERSFRSIWYPASDDVDLFDDSMSWVMSVDHDGCVILRLAEN